MSLHRNVAVASLALAWVSGALVACGEPVDTMDTATGESLTGLSSTSASSGSESGETSESSGETDTQTSAESSTMEPTGESDTDTDTDTDESDTADAETSESDTATSETDSGGLDPELIIFEEDFEEAAQDSVPAGWDSFVAWQVNAANEPGGQVFALVDSSRPYAGNNSLHVKGGSNPGMLTRPLPPGTQRIFVRSYVWLSAKMGQNPGNNHETLIGVRGTPGQASDEVRFGEIKGVIGTNEVPSDDITPTMEQWGMGPVVEAGQWNCIEVAFVADEGAHRVEAWNNGEQIHLVDDPSQWNNMVLGDNFLDGKFVEFVLGWHSFSNYDNELWFDDVVVALERVGC